MSLERKPRYPIPRDVVPKNSIQHRIKDGESWKTLSDRYGIAVESIIYANFQTLVPEEVNWYLKRYVGCTKSTRDGKNWMFSSGARPGIIHIPPKKFVFPAETITVKHPHADIDPGPFRENNTDLEKFSHGHFDVRYEPSSAALITTFRVKYKFESGITPAEQRTVKLRLSTALKTWTKAPFVLKTDDPARNPIISLRFELATGPNPHKTIDVENEPLREWVGSDLNVHKGTSLYTYVHELGHIFGNYDEYGGEGVQAWLERRMWWHDNDHLSDDRALMHSGQEFRARYFDHFANFVNKHFRKHRVTYRAVRVTR